MMSRPESPDLKARLETLDKVLNVLLHADWRELYLRWSEEMQTAQSAMDHAPDWESFVAARAVKLYITERLIGLRELVEAERMDIEAELASQTQPALPPDYEAD